MKRGFLSFYVGFFLFGCKENKGKKTRLSFQSYLVSEKTKKNEIDEKDHFNSEKLTLTFFLNKVYVDMEIHVA